jgi:putative DNA methylase
LIYRKKLIEVALPLDEINAESAREKSIRHGHPSTLHLWWARRPLAACRAVLFASLVDDPSEPDAPPELLQRMDELPAPEPLPVGWDEMPEDERRRQQLFAFIRKLVKWENSSDERVLAAARRLILAATEGDPPPALDPFCGGGSIPLEAQRLGLEAHGSDLNPVAVMITKALIELPPKFAGDPPVNPESRKTADLSSWRGAQGLAEDVRYYGAWMRERAKERIGYLYPTGPDGETVIAWLWARTVRCPNPACGATMPLVSSFWLSKKPNRKAWVEPVVAGGEERPDGSPGVRFVVKDNQKVGSPPDPPKLGRGARFRCLVCDQISDEAHIKSEGKAGWMGQQLMAVVAEGHGGRKYLDANAKHRAVAEEASPNWKPDAAIASNPRDFRTQLYGMPNFADLFTPRQLVALGTFSDLVGEAREATLKDALASGLPEELAVGYADAVATYLAFGLSRLLDLSSTICPWSSNPAHELVVHMFTRQAIPMTWDYGEVNPLSNAASWDKGLSFIIKVLERLPVLQAKGEAHQADAVQVDLLSETSPVISTDPPYYDNVGYADLSDYFYVWLRRTLGNLYPQPFGTMLAPTDLSTDI